MASALVSYIAASTNRHAQAASSSGSLVVFGSSRFLALWNMKDEIDEGVYETLPGHNGLVTAVKFMADDALLSGDEQGELKYWKQENQQWRCFASTKAHAKAIFTLAVHDQVIVTGGSDSNLKIWHLKDENLVEIQTISLKGKYPLSTDLALLPGTSALVLAVGTTEKNAHIWTRSEDTFVYSATLYGHEDWVKSLAFRPPVSEEHPLVLASGSQDGTIRLWNIEPYTKQSLPTKGDAQELSDELLDEFEASLGDLNNADEGGRQISMKHHILTIKSGPSSSQFSITFDALLIGHEAGVTSVSWRLSSDPTLLSTSTDSSLILWSPSSVLGSTPNGSTSLWINRQRFGDVGGQRLGGFVGGLWARQGSEALAWGWNGGWRRWRCDNVDVAGQPEVWSEVGAITGHSAPVRDLSWSPSGAYLISVSLDQTTRIHASVPSELDGSPSTWHEISRPQVHGYDLVGVAFLNETRFISVADEKVARVFEAPKEFAELVDNLRIAKLAVNEKRPRAATVPPLGLSNKAITEGSDVNLPSHDLLKSKRRPFEGELAAITLWPEAEKVFGHGYESITVSVSASKKLAATACKATTAEHAVVRVYDTTTWRPFGNPLAGHSLTVTRIAFSPDDRFILTVSRDRTWRLFELADEQGCYVAIAADKSHSRIIWDCSWAPDGKSFATASRDKTVKIWQSSDNKKWTVATTLKLREAATAVAFSSGDDAVSRWLAVGVESGEIFIYANQGAEPIHWVETLVVPSQTAHLDQIHRLAWRPSVDGITRQLASCSEDGTLKVLLVHIGTVYSSPSQI